MKLPCMGTKIGYETRDIFLFSEAQVDRAVEIRFGGQAKTYVFGNPETALLNLVSKP